MCLTALQRPDCRINLLLKSRLECWLIISNAPINACNAAHKLLLRCYFELLGVLWPALVVLEPENPAPLAKRRASEGDDGRFMGPIAVMTGFEPIILRLENKF